MGHLSVVAKSKFLFLCEISCLFSGGDEYSIYVSHGDGDVELAATFSTLSNVFDY